MATPEVLFEELPPRAKKERLRVLPGDHGSAEGGPPTTTLLNTTRPTLQGVGIHSLDVQVLCGSQRVGIVNRVERIKMMVPPEGLARP